MTRLFAFLLLSGCASLENDDSYWNKTVRDPGHWDSGVWQYAKKEMPK